MGEIWIVFSHEYYNHWDKKKLEKGKYKIESLE